MIFAEANATHPFQNIWFLMRCFYAKVINQVLLLIVTSGILTVYLSSYLFNPELLQVNTSVLILIYEIYFWQN